MTVNKIIAVSSVFLREDFKYIHIKRICCPDPGFQVAYSLEKWLFLELSPEKYKCLDCILLTECKK